jgi:Family of unknown function (DUF695)
VRLAGTEANVQPKQANNVQDQVMSIFRRKASAGPSDARHAAIAAFWDWWVGTASGQVAAALVARRPEQVVELLTARTKKIDPGMAWELGPGTTSEHVLVVSAEGDPALRGICRRWLLAAPPADPTWQYSDVRLPAASPETVTLAIDGARLDVASVQVGARVVGPTVNVVLHHPAFSTMTEQQRTQAAFLLLDAVLGEGTVETWIGTIAASISPSLDSVPLAMLTSVVDTVRSDYLDEDGRPRWTLLAGTAPDGAAVIASAQVPLRAVTAPHLDTYVGLGVRFSDVTDAGLPGARSLPELRDLEDHISRRLAESGRIVAHETHAGLRVLHAYVDGTTPAVEQLRAALSGWTQGPIAMDVRPDPAWDAVAHLRGGS